MQKFFHWAAAHPIITTWICLSVISAALYSWAITRTKKSSMDRRKKIAEKLGDIADETNRTNQAKKNLGEEHPDLEIHQENSGKMK